MTADAGRDRRPPRPRLRIVVLASGVGSTFQAIVDAAAADRFAGGVVGLVCDRAAAPVLARAAATMTPATLLERRPSEQRALYDARLAAEVEAFGPDLVVLAGFMRVLTTEFLGRFPGKVVNLHPALPGEHPGMDAIARAHAAARTGGVARTGAMVHWVLDEGVDDGPVIATCEIPIGTNDTIATLTARVHAAEHVLIVRALTEICGPLSA